MISILSNLKDTNPNNQKMTKSGSFHDLNKKNSDDNIKISSDVKFDSNIVNSDDKKIDNNTFSSLQSNNESTSIKDINFNKKDNYLDHNDVPPYMFDFNDKNNYITNNLDDEVDFKFDNIHQFLLDDKNENENINNIDFFEKFPPFVFDDDFKPLKQDDKNKINNLDEIYNQRIPNQKKENTDKRFDNYDIKHNNINNIESKKNENIKVDNSIEKEDKNNFIYSDVIEFSSAMPIESFTSDYSKLSANRCVSLDSRISEEDFITFIRTHPDIESLDMSNCDNIVNFNVLNILKELKELNVNNCDYFNNIECITECKKLEVLNIGNTQVSNIDNIGLLPNLKLLNCTCIAITNLGSIERCEKLKELSLWGCTGLDNLSELANIYNLRLLDIDGTTVSDIFPLVNNKNIEFLFMDNCLKITDIYALESLNKLRCLLLDGKNILTTSQLEVFKNLVNLEYLTLKSRKITDIRYFSKMVKMKELILDGNDILDLSPLENMIDVKKIDLSANSRLRDLSPLYKMTKLEKLIAGGGGSVGGKLAMKNSGSVSLSARSNMNIDNIKVVENFTKLKEINLSSNIKLRNIDSMRACTNMEEVYLQNCTLLEDVSVLGELKTIQKIDVSCCPKIKELFFLRNLKGLLELKYNGTSVYTPGLTSILKRSNGIYLLAGNDSNMISKNMIASGKKKAKLTKAFTKYFATKNKDENTNDKK